MLVSKRGGYRVCLNKHARKLITPEKPPTLQNKIGFLWLKKKPRRQKPRTL